LQLSTYLIDHIINYNSLIQALFLNSPTLCASKIYTTIPHSTILTEMIDVQEHGNHKIYAAQIYFV
jgi:hypothetical protein